MRLKSGIDLWECEECGEVVIMGRFCPTCGASYADKLIAETTGNRAERKPKQRKFREPAEEREFTKSYMFKKGK